MFNVIRIYTVLMVGLLHHCDLLLPAQCICINSLCVSLIKVVGKL